MCLIRGLIGSELGSFLSITAVDAIESKIFQNRQPLRTQRASTHQYRCARAAGLAQLRIAELEHAIWASASTSIVASIVASSAAVRCTEARFLLGLSIGERTPEARRTQRLIASIAHPNLDTRARKIETR